MDVRIPRPRSGFCPWPMWDRKRLRLCLTLSLLGAVVGCQTTISATPSATPAPTITPFGTDRSPTPAPSSTVAVSPGPTGRHEVFELTGPTYEDDVQPAAALLKDGRVLLVGGSLPAAEIYEPATREFTITGPLLRDMVSPAAVTLGDGRVLVVGVGNGDDRIATQAELYDPALGEFQAANPPIDRGGAAVALLADGRVLIAGGGDVHSSSDECLRSADVFDPASGKFTKTGSMAVARSDASATLLSDGRVLIAGGGSCGDPQSGTADTYAAAEVYDPVAGKFSRVADMTVEREWHTATALRDGRVLITGGFSYVSGSYLSSAEIFDPVTGTFAATAPMSIDRGEHVGALLPNGKVLVAGGLSNDNLLVGLASAELFDPHTGQFTATGSMHFPRTAFSATLLSSGEVLMAGGNGAERECELYLP